MKINYSKIAKRILSKYYKAKSNYTKQPQTQTRTPNNTKANNNNNHNSPH
nr:MAG TPA: hypothetical protein [Caudoviricetes sp.]